MRKLKIMEYPQWMLWDFDKDTLDQKRLVNLNGHYSGSTWTHDYRTFDQAYATSQKHNVQGLAFCFTPDDPFTGVDLDKCLDAFQSPNHEAGEILLRFMTYAEVSPSMRGVKIWCEGKVPDRCAHKVGWVEMYDQGRFFTFTGIPFTDLDVQPMQHELDWLANKYLRVEQSVTAKSQPIVTARDVSPVARVMSDWEVSLASRIEEFVLSCEIHPAGSRNDAIYRIASGAFDFDHYGQRPTREMVFEFVWRYCQGMIAAHPVMSEKEIWATVCSAEVHRKNRPPKTAEKRLGFAGQYPVTHLEMSQQAFLSKPAETSLPEGASYASAQEIQHVIDGTFDDINEEHIDPEDLSLDDAPTGNLEFPMELLEAPGYIGEFCRVAMNQSLYQQPQFTLGAALAAMSCMTARRVRFGALRSNIYVINVGPAGCGKEASRQMLKAIAQRIECDPAIPNRQGKLWFASETVTSGASITSYLVERNPTAMFLFDEFSTILKNAKSFGGLQFEAVKTVLMTLWSSSNSIWKPTGYANVERNKFVHQPHCVVFASSTDDIWRHIDSVDISSGFIPRMLVMNGEYVQDQDMDPVPMVPSQVMVDTARLWAQHPIRPLKPGETIAELEKDDPKEGFQIIPEPRDIPIDGDAKARLRRHRRDINSRRMTEGTSAAAIWTRTAERTSKLAMLFSCSRDWGSIIALEDVNRAILLSNWCTRNMVKQMGLHQVDSKSKSDRDERAVLAALKKAGPEGLIPRQLMLKTRQVDTRDRNAAIKNLLSSHEIVQISGTRSRANGRSYPTLRYALAKFHLSDEAPNPVLAAPSGAQ